MALCHHGQMRLNSGPAFGADQAKEVLALLGRTPSNLPSGSICGQSIQKSRPVVLRECVCDCPSHAPTIVPRFGTSGFQVSWIAGKLRNALDLFFCVAHWSDRSTRHGVEPGGSNAAKVERRVGVRGTRVPVRAVRET